MTSTRIGLIIIDSVAAVFRTYTNYIERAKDMRKLANSLLHLADKYNCAVICVNQVSKVSNFYFCFSLISLIICKCTKNISLTLFLLTFL